MPGTVVCRRVDPLSDALVDLSSLFEQYRIHYGRSPAPLATLTWVSEMAASGDLAFYGAHQGSRMVGFAAVHTVPASLRLGRFWQLRDLFADPGVRRQGIGRRLVETVRDAAGDAGAVRLSLQTEPDNLAALALYRRCGLTVEADLTTLSVNLTPRPSGAPPEPILEE